MGRGPPFTGSGTGVRYRMTDLDAWAAERRTTTTAEADRLIAASQQRGLGGSCSRLTAGAVFSSVPADEHEAPHGCHPAVLAGEAVGVGGTAAGESAGAETVDLGRALVALRRVTSHVPTHSTSPEHSRLVDRQTSLRGLAQSPLRAPHLRLRVDTMLKSENVPTYHSNGGLVTYLVVNQ